jgi:hypothetical protein
LSVSVLPSRRDSNAILNVSLLALFVVSFVSGWAAAWMGLTEFGLHKYSSIAVLLVAGAHLGLHRRPLALQVRRLFGRGEVAPVRRMIHLVERQPPAA